MSCQYHHWFYSCNNFLLWLTRNPEIGNSPVWVLPNIYRLGRISDNKFGLDVCNKTLLNATKCKGHSFYRLWVIKGKPRGEGGEIIPSTSLGLTVKINSVIIFVLKALLPSFLHHVWFISFNVDYAVNPITENSLDIFL